jgi:hypothetical protein
MKAFWYQGGLHFEPETPQEGAAMRLLYDSVRRSSVGAENAGEGPKAPGEGANSKSSVLTEQFSEGLVANQ